MTISGAFEFNPTVFELLRVQRFSDLIGAAANVGSAVAPSGAGAGGAGPAAGTAAGTAALQSFLAAIPQANDGDVIRADHFNAIRAALVHLANALDIEQVSTVVTPTFTPILLSDAASDGRPWRTAEGFAVGPADGDSAQGWMVVQLPNLATIDSLTIRGMMPVKPQIWTVELRRQQLAGTLVEPICSAEIQDTTVAGDRTFSVTIPVISEGITPGQRDDRRRIDNFAYRYLISTSVGGANQVAALEVRALSVTCNRS